MALRDSSPELGGPWFGIHPTAAITVAGALFAAIFALGLARTGEQEAMAALFALPITLVAFTFGARRGLIAGCVALALTAMWVVAGGVDRSATNWASISTALVLIGLLVGHASDRAATAHALQLRLERAEMRQREAADVNDTILQRVAVAKWMFEAGRPARGLEVLTETVDYAQTLVSGLLAESDALRDAG
jgi:hypothetical protein